MVEVQVYSLVSSVKRHLPDFTQLPPGHRTCSFVSHLNSPGSIQAGCHFRCTELFKHTNCPTRYALTPGLRECTCRQSALPRSTMLEQIQGSARIWTHDLSLVHRACYDWATTPHICSRAVQKVELINWCSLPMVALRSLERAGCTSRGQFLWLQRPGAKLWRPGSGEINVFNLSFPSGHSQVAASCLVDTASRAIKLLGIHSCMITGLCMRLIGASNAAVSNLRALFM